MEPNYDNLPERVPCLSGQRSKRGVRSIARRTIIAMLPFVSADTVTIIKAALGDEHG